MMLLMDPRSVERGWGVSPQLEKILFITYISKFLDNLWSVLALRHESLSDFVGVRLLYLQVVCYCYSYTTVFLCGNLLFIIHSFLSDAYAQFTCLHA
jgi:hypothetical protein